MKQSRDAFWEAWQLHLNNTSDPSATTIDAFSVAAEVIERWVDIAPEEFGLDGSIILEHMAKFIDLMPLVNTKH